MDYVRSTKNMINPSFHDLIGDLSFEEHDKDNNYAQHIDYQVSVKEEIISDSKEDVLKNISAISEQQEERSLEINFIDVKKEVIDSDYELNSEEESNHASTGERVFVKYEVEIENSNNAGVKEEKLIDDPVFSDPEADPLEFEISKEKNGKEFEVHVDAKSVDIRADIESSNTIYDSRESIEKNGISSCRDVDRIKVKEENASSASNSIDVKEKTKPPSILKQLKCHYCDKYLSGYTSFKTHLRIHTGEKPYFCNCCNNSFRQYSDLQRHVRSHTGEKPFSCEFCKKSFNRSTNLKTHLRIHTGERPFPCEFCPKSFSEGSNLKVHLRTHTGEKPFSCKFCNRTFGESGHFRHHIRTHTGEKPFTCQYCERSFYQSTHLKNHLRTHTGERPFPCNLCQKSFTRASCLRNHLQRLHKK